jgi:predicted helicase
VNFDEVMTKYRTEARSEREKGDGFERLTIRFLKTYPVYDDRFSDVLQWQEFANSKGIRESDSGIDIVVKTNDGEYWAVQVKFYQEGGHVAKADLDSFLATSGRSFRCSEETVSFSRRILVFTTDNWSSNAENSIKGQNPPVFRIPLTELRNADVDWGRLYEGFSGPEARPPKKEIRDYQQEAIDKAREVYKSHNRGKLILPCGCGKTFNALKIVESETGGRGLVLFLAPSIALVGQTLRAWSADATRPFYGFCVCSDPAISKGSSRISDQEDEDSYGTVDLPLPVTTSPEEIAQYLRKAARLHDKRLSVVFSTYQSAGAVSAGAKKAKTTFDVMVCDEAHRTTGLEELEGGKENKTFFSKIHDDGFIPARKRLYMTATPRIYVGNALVQAEARGLRLFSMDDKAVYGEEIHRMFFSAAVEREYLSDYKVIVLTLGKEEGSPELDAVLREVIAAEKAKGKNEIDTDYVTRFMGCLYAFSKRMDTESELIKDIDPAPMRKVVAFCESIRKSRQISSFLDRFNKDAKLQRMYFSDITEEEKEKLVELSCRHVDGTMGAAERGGLMTWLEDSPKDGNECRILSNVFCLSEGVDVPSLDAVVFLSQKKSDIQIVQSVGRVMRRAPGKKFGYIVIPIVIPQGIDPASTLTNHSVWGVLWDVLKALKAHDDRFDSVVNKLRFNTHKDDMLNVAGKPMKAKEGTGDPEDISRRESPDEYRDSKSNLQEMIEAQAAVGGFRAALYAKAVKMTGSERDMEIWAAGVGEIAKSYIRRISDLISEDGEARSRFEAFVKELQRNINPSVDEEEVKRMLAQHAASMPVFEALFEGYSFAAHNPVSMSMQGVLDRILPSISGDTSQTISKAYQTEEGKVDLSRAKRFVQGIDNAAGRQAIIVELYDKFFRKAFPDAVERLGIVYTPIEVVDFIIHSVAGVLEREFGRKISDENVHILDPFTGTGTFITRLILSDLLGDSLDRKYRKELHANEIVLLAYYIASINIESAFDEKKGPGVQYVPFDGICLTDTFQLEEQDSSGLKFTEIMKLNNERVNAQKDTPIMVIIGNPPYSVGQKSENDNAQNQDYPSLDEKISTTYAANSNATLKKSLFDTYVKAFRWATDRIGKSQPGIVAYVTNAGWLDGNAMDGMRKCLAKDFSSIYVFNLRGDARTSGELRRKEKDNVFGQGTRTPVAVTVLVRNPAKKGPAEIFYSDIGDYLSRDDKLWITSTLHDIYNPDMGWVKIVPNKSGDWLNQRSEVFTNLIQIGDKDDKDNLKSFFAPYYSLGILSARDSWCYNFSQNSLKKNIENTIRFYNLQRKAFHASPSGNDPERNVRDIVDNDSTQISWTRNLLTDLSKDKQICYKASNVVVSSYRPFIKQYLYYDRSLNEMVYQIPKLFPIPENQNQIICVSGIGVTKEFSAIMTNNIPDYELIGKSMCFPLYWYEKEGEESRRLFSLGKDITKVVNGYIRHDGITDWIFAECRRRYGKEIPRLSKGMIFHFVYGILHSPCYRETFSAELKKSLPRIPILPNAEDFLAFAVAGRALAKLHLGYETVKPCPAKVNGIDAGHFQVEKMRFAKGTDGKPDRTVIQYNSFISVEEIPLNAYKYIVNGKSAIEWIMERNQIKTDKDSGIKNDPNDWANEHGEPRYILDLLLRVITVSLETMRIIGELPKLDFT